MNQHQCVLLQDTHSVSLPEVPHTSPFTASLMNVAWVKMNACFKQTVKSSFLTKEVIVTFKLQRSQVLMQCNDLGIEEFFSLFIHPHLHDTTELNQH